MGPALGGPEPGAQQAATLCSEQLGACQHTSLPQGGTGSFAPRGLVV
jgi:hypothetical protein